MKRNARGLLYVFLVLVALFCAAAMLHAAEGTGFGDSMEGEVVKPEKTRGAVLSSEWAWELVRDGEVIDRWSVQNIVTTQGIAAMLDAMFNGSTQATTWYALIYNNSYTPAITETYQGPSYTESTGYDESDRPTVTFDMASGTTSITNSANKASFTMSGTTTIYGAALVSGVTPGDISSGHTVYNISNFSSAKSVENGDVLKLTVTVFADDDGS